MEDEHKWNVREGFGDHEVRVDLNETTGRAVIRLDGRIIAPPFEGNHDEREFRIGPHQYRVIRSAHDRFNLELVPGVTHSGKVARPDAAVKSTALFANFIKLAIFAVVAVFAFGAWQMGSAYFTTWENVDSVDGGYSVKMPGSPKMYQEGGMNIAELETFDTFYYAASRILNREGRNYNDALMLNEMVRRYKKLGAEIVEVEELRRHDMVAGRMVTMHYTGELDGEQVDSSMKLLACTTHDYLVVIAAEYRRGKPAPRMKVDRYFTSLKLGM